MRVLWPKPQGLNWGWYHGHCDSSCAVFEWHFGFLSSGPECPLCFWRVPLSQTWLTCRWQLLDTEIRKPTAIT